MELKVFRIGILKLAIAGMLGTMLVAPFAASVRDVQEFHLERAAAPPGPAADSARVLKDIKLSGPVYGAYQANPAMPQYNALPAVAPKIGSILAGAVLGLPIGLVALGFWRRNRAA